MERPVQRRGNRPHGQAAEAGDGQGLGGHREASRDPVEEEWTEEQT